MGNISYASDEEIVAAWRLLHGHDVTAEFDLERESRGIVTKLGSCDIGENDRENVQWSVNKQHLRLIIAQRGIEAKLH